MSRKNNSSNSSSSSGIGFIGLLQVAFIVLKLLEIIKWSWFWVLFPVIISVTSVIMFIGIMVFVFGGKK